MSKCNVPCIVNVSQGFRLVFCGESAGHSGDHSLTIQNTPAGFKARVQWSYSGKTAHGVGASPAAAIRNRCDSWAHTAQTLKLEPSQVKDPGMFDPLFLVMEPDGHPTGFCCEKRPDHEGEHARSGVFGPLGITWRITW
jgi:hypothetical protein